MYRLAELAACLMERVGHNQLRLASCHPSAFRCGRRSARLLAIERPATTGELTDSLVWLAFRCLFLPMVPVVCALSIPSPFRLRTASCVSFGRCPGNFLTRLIAFKPSRGVSTHIDSSFSPGEERFVDVERPRLRLDSLRSRFA